MPSESVLFPEEIPEKSFLVLAFPNFWVTCDDSLMMVTRLLSKLLTVHRPQIVNNFIMMM